MLVNIPAPWVAHGDDFGVLLHDLGNLKMDASVFFFVLSFFLAGRVPGHLFCAVVNVKNQMVKPQGTRDGESPNIREGERL